MAQTLDCPHSAETRLGPYVATRPLGAGPLGERQLALHELDNSSHVLHRIAGRDRFEQRKFLALAAVAQGLRHPHVLAIEDFGLDHLGRPWIATPYTGDATGLSTLGRHLRAKGGYLSPLEARQAVLHLLEASAAAHAASHAHGEVSLDEVLVDRRGALVIELYGLARARRTGESLTRDARVRAAEVRSIVRIGYQLVTGLLPEVPVIAASRVVGNLDPWWDGWFETGLSESGFASAAHAASALVEGASVPARGASGGGGGVRSVLRRLLAAGV